MNRQLQNPPRQTWDTGPYLQLLGQLLLIDQPPHLLPQHQLQTQQVMLDGARAAETRDATALRLGVGIVPSTCFAAGDDELAGVFGDDGALL